MSGGRTPPRTGGHRGALSERPRSAARSALRIGALACAAALVTVTLLTFLGPPAGPRDEAAAARPRSVSREASSAALEPDPAVAARRAVASQPAEPDFAARDLGYGGLRFRVHDEQGGAVPGARIEVRHRLIEPPLAAGVTDGQGALVLRFDAGHARLLTVDAEGHARYREHFEPGAWPAVIRVRLRAGGALSVKVVDQHGAPAEHARVELHYGSGERRRRGTWTPVLGLRADASGMLRVGELERGRWTVKAPSWRDWDDAPPAVVTVTAAGTAEVLLEVPRAAREDFVSLLVLPESVPIESVEVRVPELDPQWSPAMDEGGRRIFLPTDRGEAGVLELRIAGEDRIERVTYRAGMRDLVVRLDG